MNQYEKFLNQTRKLRPIHKLEWQLLVAILLLFTSGILVSLFTHDWQNLDRTGALIVIVGIFVAWKDLTGRMNSIEEMVKINLLKAIPQTSSGGLLSQAVKLQAENLAAEQKRVLEEFLNAVRKRCRTIECLILAMGTFLWGFGSVVPNLIVASNA